MRSGSTPRHGVGMGSDEPQLARTATAARRRLCDGRTQKFAVFLEIEKKRARAHAGMTRTLKESPFLMPLNPPVPFGLWEMIMRGYLPEHECESCVSTAFQPPSHVHTAVYLFLSPSTDSPAADTCLWILSCWDASGRSPSSLEDGSPRKDCIR